ncbi:MAG: glycine--tRNA ligase subunit beta [Candidatus Kuenenia stuttgartiensis]|nr:MAG: glycine--tRNA ligase subunit beta [Candidatus Kuenenia stuttgartiensis]
MTDLLFEIGTEEIPAGYITPALNQIKTLFGERFKYFRLTFQSIYCTGTPRRLVVFIKGLPEEQESVTEEIQGPSVAIAFDKAGNLTKAGLGFAKSQGIESNTLQTKKTAKGEYCIAIKQITGEKTLHLLPGILEEIIQKTSFPKSMKWKTNNLFFARPIRSLLALFGNKVVPLEINGIKAGNVFSGHPFLSGKKIEIQVADWEQYKQLLKQEKVIVDIPERRNILKEKITKLMKQHGATFDDESLLDEVANLVEYPNAVTCSFDDKFLDIPDIVIETAMKEHQRYFPVKKADGKLINKFIVALNRDEPNENYPIQGNERVLKARLYDARFFWKEDRKIPLEKRVEDLKQLVFLEKLGNYYERTGRIVALTDYLSKQLIRFNHPDFSIADIDAAKRAALLCKTDLLTQMVGEFPSLQGIMGREYAAWDGEEPAVALAIEEHYLPRFAADKIPSSIIGAIVGLADKFDTISGCFALGLHPTGSQDPYSLRRHAYGIIRIIEEHGFTLMLEEVLGQSLSILMSQTQSSLFTSDKLIPEIKNFFRERLFHTNIEKGCSHDLVNAVLNAGAGFDDMYDFLQRLKDVSMLSKEKYWPDLVSVVERTFNISKKVKGEGMVSTNLLNEKEELQLWEIYTANEAKIRTMIQDKKYVEASFTYNEVFAEPVHAFFEKVFVNVEDMEIRNNRLLLLREINQLYSEKIADLSQIIMTEKVYTF